MTSAEDQSIPSEVGFQRAIGLLEFDQIRLRLAETTRTALGGEAAVELAPSSDPRDVVVRQQETAEARRLLDTTGALELGPGEDLRPAVQRALLGGVLRGEELQRGRIG
jgi:dsDNA-specific endonuclease/ATPase MutS2